MKNAGLNPAKEPARRPNYRTEAWLPALLVCLLVSVPWLTLLVTQTSPIVLTSEAIGYRFFHPLRIQSGDAGTLFLPQGQTLGLFHHLLVLVVRLGSSGTFQPLRRCLDGFAFATNVLLAVTLFSALRLAARERLRFAMAAASTLFAVYGCRSGIYNMLAPDYYGFELAATIIVIGLAGRWSEAPPPRRGRALVGLGIMTGLMAGMKFTLAASSLLVLMPFLATPDLSFRRLVRELVIFCGSSAAIFLLVLAVYYCGHLSALPTHFRQLLSYVRQAGGEDRFWPSLFTPNAPAAEPGADYGYARFALVIWLVALTTAGFSLWSAWSRRLAVVAATALVLGLLHAWGLLTRPAGSTLWEACLCLLAGATGILTALPAGRWRKFGRIGSVGLLTIVAVTSGPRHLGQILPVGRLQAASAAIWQAHDQFMASPGKRIFLIPDNNFTAGTVEETLMKGASDFPSWQIKSGEWILHKLGGDMVVVHDPEQVPSAASVLMVETASRGFSAPSGYSVKKWDLVIYPWWPRTLALYRPPFAGTTLTSSPAR